MTNRRKYRKVKRMIKSFFRACRNVGIRCEKNWTCCGTCGHDDMEDAGEKNYIFYNWQEAARIKKGSQVVHLQHHFTPEVKERVLALISNRKRVEWNGDDTISIVLTC
jgi:hypothetical protein